VVAVEVGLELLEVLEAVELDVKMARQSTLLQEQQTVAVAVVEELTAPLTD
jgi:hypothetical protein